MSKVNNEEPIIHKEVLPFVDKNGVPGIEYEITVNYCGCTVLPNQHEMSKGPMVMITQEWDLGPTDVVVLTLRQLETIVAKLKAQAAADLGD